MSKFELPRDVSAGRTAREALGTILEDVPVATPDVARLLVDEVVNNAVEHGSGAITLETCLTEAVLHVDVTDEGKSRPHLVDAGPGEGRGRGIYLLDRLASAWGVTEGARNGRVVKTVWFELPLVLENEGVCDSGNVQKSSDRPRRRSHEEAPDSV